MNKLKIELSFDDPGRTDFPDRHTIAELGIAVGDDYLTRHKRGARMIHGGAKFSNTVYGPVAGLADWFIENWSFVLWESQTPFKRARTHGLHQVKPAIPGAKEAADFWEDYTLDGSVFGDAGITDDDLAGFADWQQRHLLGYASSELALPSIVVVPEDQTVLVCVDRPPSGSMRFYGPDDAVRTPFQYVIAKEEFRSVAAKFVELVIERVETVGKHTEWVAWMRKRWRDAQIAESNRGNQLELMIGPVSARRVNSLQKNSPLVAQGLSQLLLDCRIVETSSDLNPVVEVLTQYVGANGTNGFAGEIPGWQQVTNVKVAMSQPEYMQGYKLAQHLRKHMQIGNRPIEGVNDVLNKLDVSLENDRMIPLFRAAACATKGHQAHIIPSSSDPRMKSYASRNFAVVSALGRLIWEARMPDENTICVAQGDYSILSESRRANAFAAEFLLPAQVVSKFEHQSPELLKVADQYGISHEAANLHAMDIERLSRNRRG